MLKKKVEEKKPLTRSQKLAIRARASAKEFHKQLNNSINTAIIAGFGFLLALAWRDVIGEWVASITSSSPIQGKLIEAVLITVIAVIGIIIVSKIFAKKE